MAPNYDDLPALVPSVFTVAPSDQPKEPRPGQLSKEQLEQFFNEGYIVLNDVGEKPSLQHAIKYTI